MQTQPDSNAAQTQQDEFDLDVQATAFRPAGAQRGSRTLVTGSHTTITGVAHHGPPTSITGAAYHGPRTTSITG